MDNEQQKRTILDYLENAYTGARMMGDIEVQTRIGRAIVAFNADVHEDIFIAREETEGNSSAEKYVVNNSSKKFHRANCSCVDNIPLKHRRYDSGSKESLIADGFLPCENCKP